MFEPTSRYTSVATAKKRLPDGREVAYKRRRFLPRSESLPLLGEVDVRQEERVDQLTARTLRDPEQFWRLADANDAMDPAELEESGRRVRIPVPTAEPASAATLLGLPEEPEDEEDA